MSDHQSALLKVNFKQLRLPTMLAEFEQLAREAADANQSFLEFLLRLTELEVSARTANALAARIKQAGFPTGKGLETFDFTATPSLGKQKVLELARCEWLARHENCCLIGNSGTGKTHAAEGLGRAACYEGYRVRFFTAAGLVNKLEEARRQYQLDRFLAQLDKVDLLIVDELGYLSFSRAGAELLFQVFADRYERKSLLLTSNLAFSEWGQIFQGERMTAALLDRLTHHCHIFEMNGESYRFRESMKTKAKPKSKPNSDPKPAG
jgi:DNA replication protein DnaC